MKGIQSVDEELITGFERIAAQYPNKTSIVYLGEKFSYADLRELIYRFATALYELGVRSRDKVMVYVGNSPQWIIGYFAAQKIGAVPVPTSPIYTPREIAYQITDCGAETILCQDTNFGYVREIFDITPLKRAIVTNLVDLLPWWKRGIGFALNRVPSGSVKKSEGVYFFTELLRKYPPRPPRVGINPREDLAYILYTGGTTGLPKGVPATHAGTVAYVKEINEYIDGFVSEGDDCFLLVNPLYHIMPKGMFLGVALTVGNPTVVMPVPLVDAVLDAIQRYKVSLLLGVPALYRMMLENERLDLYNVSSLKYCWCGGDTLPREVFNRFRDLINHPIYQVYGSTETGHLCLSPLDREPSPTTLGIPFGSKQVKIVDPDTLEEMPAGEVGELLVTSDFILDYLNKPEETAEAFVELDGRRWYRMGDYVRMDERGELQYVDRRADIIKHKGYRVSASEVEAVLQDHEVVIGACVVGVPDPSVGERIKAIVVLKEDARGVSATDLVNWCRDRLAPYKIPQYIEFRDMLPKSKVGKLLRREIRDEERRRQGKAS